MLYLSIISYFFIHCINAVTPQQASECLTLNFIYLKMGRDLSETDCCQASGITCRDQKIVKIDWSRKSLTESIPAEIGNLQNLEML
jgi:hypothetical protein